MKLIVSAFLPRGDRWWRHVVVAAFSLTAALVLSRHEMWMDELNPWLIARDAHSLSQLRFNMRFEPHPPLWYVVLYALTRFTSDPVAMQVLHGLIATASVAVVAYCAPFRRIDIILLAFSYYFVFEFCAISRGYSLGVLFVLIACVLASSSRPRPIAIAIALGLAANTSAYGLIVAIAVAVAAAPTLRPAGWRRLTAAAAILAGGVAIATAFLLPSPENVYGADRHLRWQVTRIDQTVRLISDALFPLPNVAARSPWNSNLVEAVMRTVPMVGHYIPLLLSVAVIAAALIHLRGRFALRAALVAGTIMVLSLIYVEYTGGYRHHGHIFVVLLAVMWLHMASRSRLTPSPEWFTAILAAQMFAGVYFVSADVARPFSDSRLIAHYLSAQPHTMPIISAQPTLLNYEGPELAAYLRRHIYYATAAGVVPGSYMWYDRAHARDASEDEIVGEIDRFANEIGSDVLVVTSHWDPKSLGAPLYAPSEPTIEGDERNSAVYLYSRR